MIDLEDVTIGWQDYPSPDGCSVNVFVCGCEHNCYQCSNPELQLVDIDKFREVICVAEEIHKKGLEYRTDKICLMGGDPLHPLNRESIKELILLLREYKYKVCLYTGYSIDEVKKMNIEGCEFIKTGRYNHTLKQESIKRDEYLQFASSNQELYSGEWNLLSIKGRYYFNK